ncbi:MAG: alpha-L-rhamnosidase [Lachnospiraceae bacterium]|nr:alpha-L-rhamnosidase [Lachnospiraceae bacterium]
MAQSYWIWYPGDMERYFALKQNFSRIERGFEWPAFWKSDSFRCRVVFRRIYQLSSSTSFTVFSKASGFVLVGEKKYPFGRSIFLPAGEFQISIHAGRIDAFPSIYIKGDLIFSDQNWTTSDYVETKDQAGFSRYFTDPDTDPSEWPFSRKLIKPESALETTVRIPLGEGEDIQGNKHFFSQESDALSARGFLYCFPEELTAVLDIRSKSGAYLSAEAYRSLSVYLGESREEAVDPVHCYYSVSPDASGRTPKEAFRYVFIPGEELLVTAIHEYVDIPVMASFSSDDERINRIWETAAATFRLGSGIFFTDGIKRDRWIWAQDAYLSIFINAYFFADPDIDRRTLTALRGNDPVTSHINSIADNSMLWILGMAEHVRLYKDLGFLKEMFPKMDSMAVFLLKQTDEKGFFTGRPGDWLFIDQAELDKKGVFAAEEMLFALCMKKMAECAALLQKDDEYEFYKGRWDELQLLINRYFWDYHQGAYIDSFSSGRRFVSRQSNLLALHCGIADSAQQAMIFKNVISNPEIPPVRSSTFIFYELDALGKAGRIDELTDRMLAYWGGMLDRGASLFWEDFDLNVPEDEQYDRNGERFGKSLCHTLSASPLYFISRYIIGLTHTNDSSGNLSYELHPHLERFQKVDCALPIKGGHSVIHINK